MKNALTARILLEGAPRPFLPGAYQTLFGYAHRPEYLGDANDRHCGGGCGRANTSIRHLNMSKEWLERKNWSA
jgi:hypothetical protein